MDGLKKHFLTHCVNCSNLTVNRIHPNSHVYTVCCSKSKDGKLGCFFALCIGQNT